MPSHLFATRRCVGALLTLLACTAPAFGAEDSFQEVRATFVRALTQVKASSAASDPSDSQALRNYPLYPYLQAARLRKALDGPTATLGAADERIAAFLGRFDREPVARGLRQAWLSSLAERKQWSTFLQQYREASASDAQRCQQLTARIELERLENLSRDVAKQWLSAQRLPECEQPFDWLRATGGLSPELIEQRARLILDKGNAPFARTVIAGLPAERAAPLLQWASMLENPQRAIDALIASPQTPVDSATLLAGWSRLARRDQQAAGDRYDSLLRSRSLDEKAASSYALALALPLSWSRDTTSLAYFAKVQPGDFDDTALEWRARAALWAQDWPLVAKTIAAMSDTNRETARWRYWAARAAEQGKDQALARQLYTSVLTDDNYYSAMAAARLQQPVTPHPEKIVKDEVAQREIEAMPAFVRAHELLRANMRREAYAEWQFGSESLSDPLRTQSIHVANRWGWYDLAVATATQQRVFNDYALLYPRPFDREVHDAARTAALEPELIYGVLRQESLYRTEAVSSAGAYGLLQLLPATARRTAQHLKRPKPKVAELFIPGVNVTLGAGQLRMLLDRFGDQTPVALAGYNAGPNAAARWLPPQAIDPDIWIENIPYNETRGYVQRVLWHSIVFGWLRSNEAQRTDAWLASIK